MRGGKHPRQVGSSAQGWHTHGDKQPLKLTFTLVGNFRGLQTWSLGKLGLDFLQEIVWVTSRKCREQGGGGGMTWTFHWRKHCVFYMYEIFLIFQCHVLEMSSTQPLARSEFPRHFPVVFPHGLILTFTGHFTTRGGGQEKIWENVGLGYLRSHVRLWTVGVGGGGKENSWWC